MKIRKTLEEGITDPEFLSQLKVVGPQTRFYGEGRGNGDIPFEVIFECYDHIPKVEYLASLNLREAEILKEIIRYCSLKEPNTRILAVGSSVHNSKLPLPQTYSDIDLIFYRKSNPSKIHGNLTYTIGTKQIEGASSYNEEVPLCPRLAGGFVKEFVPWLTLDRVQETNEQDKLRFLYHNGTFQEIYQNLSLQLIYSTGERFHFTFTDSRNLVSGILEKGKEAICESRKKYAHANQLRKRQAEKLILPNFVELYRPRKEEGEKQDDTIY